MSARTKPAIPAAVVQLCASVSPATPVSAKRAEAASITSAAMSFRSTTSVATETTSAAAEANRRRLSAFDGPGAPGEPAPDGRQELERHG